MPEFDSSGVQINYIDEGSGDPVVLVHGFASSLQGNWRAPGLVDALTGAGHRVVALDCRGHGRSGKPRDPAAYEGTKMADDVIALMDHLGIEKSGLAGYSMGGMLSASLIVRHPERFSRVVLSGVGDALMLAGSITLERREAIARAMEGTKVDDEVAKGFRAFAKASGNDLEALAAMQRGRSAGFDASKLKDIRLPVMILVGTGDTLVGGAEKLAATIPGAKLVTVPGDHLTAVGQPEFKKALVDFFAA